MPWLCDAGLAFTSDTVGYAGTASNGVGPQILKTTNGGVNWTPCEATFGLDLMLLDTDATENVRALGLAVFHGLFCHSLMIFTLSRACRACCVHVARALQRLSRGRWIGFVRFTAYPRRGCSACP